MEIHENMGKCGTCFMELPKEHLVGDECIFCESYRNKWSRRDYKKKEEELRGILEYYREKHRNDRYDVLVPLSGGKDSTWVLYLAVKKFGMRPLAVTFNNGLQTQLARNNINNAVGVLAVDHVTVAPDPRELQAMYSICFRKTRNMCLVCNHIINTTVLQTAVNENISLILVGGVGKLELAPIYGNKRYCMEEVFKKILGQETGFDIAPYLNKPLRRDNEAEFITMFNYVDYDYREVLRLLKSELGWSESHHGDTKIDCLFHPVISHYKYMNNGVSSSILMASALLRDGKIGHGEFQQRTEAIREQLTNADGADIKEFFDYLEIDPNDPSPVQRILDYVEPTGGEGGFEELAGMKAAPGCDTLELLEKLIGAVRPEVCRDGGDIGIVSFKDNELVVELTGDCRSCLQADDTMIPHIESIVRKFVSKEISVERYIRRE